MEVYARGYKYSGTPVLLRMTTIDVDCTEMVQIFPVGVKSGDEERRTRTKEVGMPRGINRREPQSERSMFERRGGCPWLCVAREEAGPVGRFT